MSENVIALPGFQVPRCQAEPVHEVVEICEEPFGACEFRRSARARDG